MAIVKHDIDEIAGLPEALAEANASPAAPIYEFTNAHRGGFGLEPGDPPEEFTYDPAVDEVLPAGGGWELVNWGFDSGTGGVDIQFALLQVVDGRIQFLGKVGNPGEGTIAGHWDFLLRRVTPAE